MSMKTFGVKGRTSKSAHYIVQIRVHHTNLLSDLHLRINMTALR